MGIRNFGSLLVIFLILIMMFGTARLRDVGNDLAVAIRNFRKAMSEDDNTNKIDEKK
jgi:sec-independent protein translocase protein TatA